MRSAKLEGGGGTTGARIHDVMEAKDLPESGYHHPLQAYYSRELLGIQATEGLFSRPAASSLLVPNVAQLIREEDIGQDTDVILAASTIGGTGAGLSLQLLCRAQELGRTKGGVRLKAVLLGEYFVPDPAKLANASIRFRSNKVWFLKSLEHAVPDLLRYAWLDPDSEENKLRTRDANADLDAPFLPWSEEKQAFWQGLKAMLFLLQDRTAEAPVKFTDREVPLEQYARQAERATVDQALRTALGRADALVRHDVLRRLAFEAVPARVWGDGLTATVQGFADALVRGSNGIESDPSKFCAAAQRELKRWWGVGQENCFPLEGLFPKVARKEAGVDSIRKVRWVPSPAEWSIEAFRSSETASRATAAALLDCALRKGEQA